MSRLKFKLRIVVCVVTGLSCLLYNLVYVARVNPDKMKKAASEPVCDNCSDIKPTLPTFKGNSFYIIIVLPFFKP